MKRGRQTRVIDFSILLRLNIEGSPMWGEFVVSQARIYIILPDGRVNDLEATEARFAEE